jgi:hypothetical protein
MMDCEEYTFYDVTQRLHERVIELLRELERQP